MKGNPLRKKFKKVIKGKFHWQKQNTIKVIASIKFKDKISKINNQLRYRQNKNMYNMISNT